MGIAAFFIFFLANFASFARADPAWDALLHFSGKRSSVEAGSSFFLSPNGHKDPAAELRATQDYFAREPREAPCRFPARALYLKQTKVSDSPLCERWRKWREAISAQGAELVFAAAFLASPSSMYGHTLLKFVRAGKTSGEDLLDYTLNYGAKTGSVVGVPYIWKGLTGGFNGNYATAPFYLKVKEYNFVENRDFWIYPLKLSEAQLELLVAHSWEIREVDFPYFFLHQNCAYFLLELLEVLRPGSGLTTHFPFWTVPIDTIRLLNERDWLGTPRYRPSRYRRLMAFRAELEGEEEIVETLARTGEAGAALPAGREALLLDTAYELWRYRVEGKKDEAQVEGKLLRARAQYTDSWKPDFSRERSPETGHPSARAGLAYGQNRANPFVELQYRGTLHDILANPHGFENYSELSMGDVRVRLEKDKVFLERFDFIRLRSLAPVEKWIPRWAWSVRAGVGRAKEFPCESWQCFRGGIDGGAGVGVMLGPVLAFSLIETKVEAGSVFDRQWRFGAGPSGGIFTELWKGSRLLVEGEWRWRVMGSHLPERAARLGISQDISRLVEIRLQGEVTRGYREGAAQLYYYF